SRDISNVEVHQQRRPAEPVLVKAVHNAQVAEAIGDVDRVAGVAHYFERVGGRGEGQHVGSVEREHVVAGVREIDRLDVEDLRVGDGREIEVARQDLQG